jgi:hypothetical protein
MTWVDGLRACGIEVYVWKPVHWDSGAIEETLKGTS